MGSNKKVKITHIITGLNMGGAEHMLYKLLKHSSDHFEHSVISLSGIGYYTSKIEDLGIKVYSLNIKKKNPLTWVFQIKSLCTDADIIDSWMYHSNLFSYIVGKKMLNKKVIWNIRHSNLRPEANKRMTLCIIHLCAKFSNNIDVITYDSQKSMGVHDSTGYDNNHGVVIPGGFEIDKYLYSEKKRDNIRHELGISKDKKVMLTVGRWDVQKGYYFLIIALSILKKTTDDFLMLMVGTGLSNDNNSLVSIVEDNKLSEKIMLLGPRDDIPAILSSADIYICSSIGESFSNSIAEAMISGMTCIVTDVGDSAKIIGEFGILIPKENSEKMADAILISLNKNAPRSKNAMKYIEDNYSIKKISIIYHELYKKLLLG